MLKDGGDNQIHYQQMLLRIKYVIKKGSVEPS